MSLLQQPTPTHGFALTDYLLHHNCNFMSGTVKNTTMHTKVNKRRSNNNKVSPENYNKISTNSILFQKDENCFGL